MNFKPIFDRHERVQRVIEDGKMSTHLPVELLLAHQDRAVLLEALRAEIARPPVICPTCANGKL